MPKLPRWLLPQLLLLAPLGLGCRGEAVPAGDASATAAPIRVVATTGMIADAARHVGGARAEVVALMGPGVDPHLYKASESDVTRLQAAQLVLYNGLHLEGKMADVLVKMARTRPVVAVSETVPAEQLREPPEFQGQYDPHIWFDVRLWASTLDAIAAAYAEVDPAHADEYRANAAAYREELLALDAWVEARIAELPPERRLLVTAHDAFGYFGRRYGVDVVGLQGISTLAEAGLRDVERVVDLVVERRVKAIFVESSVPRRAIEAVQAAAAERGHQVTIGGQLFSDAMGAPDTTEGTYVGMVRHNANTLVDALR
jgi:manganese/zinc/iron transport system substrate-binding protein